MTVHAGPAQLRTWSKQVTLESDALDIESGVFTWENPRKIALSLRNSALQSTRRKADPYHSAMSMLTFFINRAGKNLAPKQRRILEQAKRELRLLFGRPRVTARPRGNRIA